MTYDRHAERRGRCEPPAASPRGRRLPARRHRTEARPRRCAARALSCVRRTVPGVTSDRDGGERRCVDRAGRAPADAGRGAAGRLAVAVPGQRLHDLPAALPLPGRSTGSPSRPARRPPAAPSSTPCWSGCSTCPAAERTLRAGGARCSRPSGSGCSRRSRSSPTLFADDDEAATRWLASRRRRCSTRYFALEDPTRLEPAERELYVETDARVRPARCAATSTGSTSPPTARMRVVDYKTGRAPSRGLRGQGDVPDALLRAGAVAAARPGARGCSSCSTSAAARCCATSPTRPTCAPPSARSRRCGRRSSGPREHRRLAAQPQPGCATGATTRRLCPAVRRHPPLPALPVPPSRSARLDEDRSRTAAARLGADVPGRACGLSRRSGTSSGFDRVTPSRPTSRPAP